MSVSFDLSTVFSTVAAAVPDQTFVVWRDRRLTYAQFDAHVDGFAHFLVSAGLGVHTERAALAATSRARTISASTCATATSTSRR